MKEKMYDYYGYKVTKDGRVYNKKGKLLTVSKNGCVLIFKDGKKSVLSLARVVYEAVTGKELSRVVCITFKDNNPNNVTYDNIEIKTRAEYFSTKENSHKFRKFDEKTCEEIRKKYNREERQKHNFAGEYAHPTYQELADEYECSKSTILNILNGTYSASERERGIGKWAKTKED